MAGRDSEAQWLQFKAIARDLLIRLDNELDPEMREIAVLQTLSEVNRITLEWASLQTSEMVRRLK